MAAEVGEAELVDLDHAFVADGAFPPGHRSGEHAVDVGVGLLRRPSHITEHRGNRQVWFQVVVAIRRVSEAGFGGRRDMWIWVGRGGCCTFSGRRLACQGSGRSWGAACTVRRQGRVPRRCATAAPGTDPQPRHGCCCSAEEVFEPPAALQCVIDCGNQRRPPRAGLEGSAGSAPMSSVSLDSQAW